MKKLYPSWKVYQGWMGCDPLTEPSLPLWEVTVNNMYEMNLGHDFGFSFAAIF
jgi:hypothetical protein